MKGWDGACGVGRMARVAVCVLEGQIGREARGPRVVGRMRETRKQERKAMAGFFFASPPPLLT